MRCISTYLCRLRYSSSKLPDTRYARVVSSALPGCHTKSKATYEQSRSDSDEPEIDADLSTREKRGRAVPVKR